MNTLLHKDHLNKQESIELAQWVCSKPYQHEIAIHLSMKSDNAILWAHLAMNGPQWDIPEDVRMNPEFRSYHTNLLIESAPLPQEDIDEIDLFFDFCDSPSVMVEPEYQPMDIDEDVMVILDNDEPIHAIPLEEYVYEPVTLRDEPHVLVRSEDSKVRSLRMKIEDMQARSLALYLQGNLGAHMAMHQCVEDMMHTFTKEFPSQLPWLQGFKSRMDNVEMVEKSTKYIIREEVADLLKSGEDVTDYLDKHPERYGYFVTEDTQRFLEPNAVAQWLIKVPALEDQVYRYVPREEVENHLIRHFTQHPTDDVETCKARVMMAPRYYEHLPENVRSNALLTAELVVGVSRKWGAIEAPYIDNPHFESLVYMVRHGSVADIDDALLQYEASQMAEKQHSNMSM